MLLSSQERFYKKLHLDSIFQILRLNFTLCIWGHSNFSLTELMLLKKCRGTFMKMSTVQCIARMSLSHRYPRINLWSTGQKGVYFNLYLKNNKCHLVF